MKSNCNNQVYYNSKLSKNTVNYCQIIIHYEVGTLQVYSADESETGQNARPAFHCQSLSNFVYEVDISY